MMTTIKLKLVKVKGETCVKITVKNAKRMTRYGFGLFLENVKPKEVLATQAAIDALCSQPQRGGIQGMEFWPANRLAFCATIVPLNAINVPTGAKRWIKKFSVAE